MKDDESKKNVIIQCSPINSASVILSNILYGLICHKEYIKYIENENINDIKEYINNVEIPIIKTHNCLIDSWLTLNKEYNLFFICSENDTVKIKEIYHKVNNLVIINYKTLIKSAKNTLEKIIDIVHSKCAKILPSTIIMNKDNALNRILSMYKLYDIIKDKPFTHCDPFYHIHGSHEKVEYIIEPPIINIPKNKRILIVSPGGCACTSFIKFLKQYVKTINCPDDTDKIKHTLPTCNLIKKYDPTHIVFLFGDIIKAVRSLFRRNYIYRQYYKLRNIPFNSHKCPFINYNQFINITVNNNCEPLGITNHYKAWKNIPNVFFINYEHINSSELLNNYLGLPEGTNKKFIIKKRSSTPSSFESHKYLEIINKLTDTMMEKNNTCNP